MNNWDYKAFKAQDLVRRINNKEILVPQYQRGQVWKNDQREKLINSIKNGYPFGTILLYLDKEDNKYRLIDGLQRSTTIAWYLTNPSNIFDEKTDIDGDILEKIIELPEHRPTNSKQIKGILSSVIADWVITKHQTMDDINNIQYIECAMKIVDKFPYFKPYEIDISQILSDVLLKFKETCKQLSEITIPAIVYEGDKSSLPQIFERINSRGIKLSKYQILAATWSHSFYTIKHDELHRLHTYAEKYFLDLYQTINTFEIEKEEVSTGQLNLYQILYGFSKLLGEDYPHLFDPVKKNGEGSSAFNLITACLGMKNQDMKDLDQNLVHFLPNNDINPFLIKILSVVKDVNKILESYITFKNNKRSNSKPVIYHTEMQICSIIANVFINKYGYINIDEDLEYTLTLNLENKNKSWKEYRSKLSSNLMIRYTHDILNAYWKGSGDSKLNEVILDSQYYANQIERNRLKNVIENWYSDQKDSIRERKQIASPNKNTKLLLLIVYTSNFNYKESKGDYVYDYEHLITKDLIRKHLKRFDNNNQAINLPGSIIGNICLLPEYQNRSKGGMTIYQDHEYKEQMIIMDGLHDESDEKKKISLKELEEKYTFTEKEEMNWVDDMDQSFETLRNNYLNFVDNRFERILNKVLDSLYIE